MIVVDTNVLVHATLPGPRSADANRVLGADPDWAAPVLWRNEFRNVLSRLLRSGRLRPDQALSLMDRAVETVGGRQGEPSSERTLSLSLQSGCTAYDCEFVALAEALGVLLVTEDRQVLDAFPGRALSMEAFARR